LPICGTTHPDKKYSISRPNSSISCIEFVEAGRGTVTIDGKTFSPSAGDSYFLIEGKTQHYFSDEKDPWKKHFINASGRLLRSLAEGYGLTGSYYFKGLDIKSELLEIIELAKGEGDPTVKIVGILNEIFIKMHDHVKKGTAESGIEAEMKDFLNTKITEKFHIDELCSHISRSESQTIRLFKRAYGITPYTYVLNKRLELGKSLLNNTNLTVKEIADKLCFADEYYFSNLFRSKVGMTPSSYRKKFKGAEFNE
jgi:AraC-like DNA-binding protein